MVSLFHATAYPGHSGPAPGAFATLIEAPAGRSWFTGVSPLTTWPALALIGLTRSIERVAFCNPDTPIEIHTTEAHIADAFAADFARSRQFDPDALLWADLIHAITATDATFAPTLAATATTSPHLRRASAQAAAALARVATPDHYLRTTHTLLT